MGRRVVIDGDILVHRSIAVATTKIEVDHKMVENGVFKVEPGTSIKAIARNHARDEVRRLVELWNRDAKGEGEPLVALSDRRRPDSTFRYFVFPGYKANRGGGAKPDAWWDIHDMIGDEYDTRWDIGLEGDDVIGLVCSADPKGWTSVSNDKDMRTIPGRHYNPDKGTTLDVSPKQADWFWMWQTITGDKTDDYPGCPGVGPKRAAEYVGTLEHPLDHLELPGLWSRVLSVYDTFQYETRYASLWPENLTVEEFAIQQARCARILRDGDYEGGGTVRLWHPDGEYQWINFANPSED